MKRPHPMLRWLRTACELPERPRRTTNRMPLADPPRRPDPAVYSQERSMANGERPTWAPEDIALVGGNPPTLVVRARNLGEVSAVNAVVRAWSSGFGIGLKHLPLAPALVSIPSGGTTEVAVGMAAYIVNEPPSVHVSIEHPHDLDAGNNQGARNVRTLRTSQSPTGRRMPLTFPLGNPLSIPLSMQLAPLAMPGVVVSCLPEATLQPGEVGSGWAVVEVDPALHGSAAAPVRLEATVVARGPDFFEGLTWEVLVDD